MVRLGLMLFVPVLAVAVDPPEPHPHLDRLEPFGGQRGTTLIVELHGKNLASVSGAVFDTPHIRWRKTVVAGAKAVHAEIEIAAEAPLGPHFVHLITPTGRTNTRLFNVTQFTLQREVEPNDVATKPQQIELKPQVLGGYLKGHADVDHYRFSARAGERWTFDLRSLEYGSHLECEMALYDAEGARVAFNDDRDDYLETPLLEHTFSQSGHYTLRIDQYRGPQGVACGDNCGYLLQISQLPLIRSMDRLGAEPGQRVRVRLHGGGLTQVEAIELRPARPAEYYRLTFPFTIPLTLDNSSPAITGEIRQRKSTTLEAEFAIPSGAPPGLWRLWTRGGAGASEGLNFEINPAGAKVIDGLLSKAENEHWIDAVAGQPIHAYTLAAQLGAPELDTVLEVFDQHGALLAEHDDLMTGQGTVIGNPDSSVYFTPARSERLKLLVRDRIGRTGPGYSYRLHVRHEKPGFQLLAEPEEFAVSRGAQAPLGVLLIPDPGFAEAVDIWAEGAPNGVTIGLASFPANHVFGPSGDGDNVLIPSVELKVSAAADAATGEHAIRILGRSMSGRTMEAFSTLWIGPNGKRNDIRRPLRSIRLTVY